MHTNASKSALILLFLAFSFSIAQAATKTWVPINGGAWTTASNWAPAGVPATDDDVIINSDQSAPITAVPNVTLRSLTVSGTCTLLSTAGRTITLRGNTGTNFTISTEKTLTLGSSVNITLAANTTASIAGTLSIGSSSTFNSNNNGVVTTVTGTIINGGNVNCLTDSKMLFQSGSTYQHNVNGGNIPISTWDVNSTCEITGYTTTNGNPANYTTIFAQEFGNFTWNCTNQRSSISLGGILTTVNGNFTMLSTGTHGAMFSFGNTGIGNVTIGGDYIQSGGNVYGTGWTTSTAAATRTINIAGDFSITGGTFNLSSSSDASSATTLNIGKNFTQGSGTTITETGNSTSSAIRFVSSATPHLYTSGGTVLNTVNYIVDNGAVLQMGTAASPSNISGGNGSFTLQSGGTLLVTSPAGITASGNSGNIQVSGTRSYSGGNIHYIGTAAQATGNGLTAAANVSILNTSTSGVTFTVQATVSGNISMATGAKANLGTGFTHTASSLTLGGTAQATNNTYGGDSSTASQKNATFFPNTATGIISLGNCIAGSWIGITSTDWHTGSNWCSGNVPTSTSDITITAATNQPLISAAAVCNNITINPGATVTLNGINTLTVSGDFYNNGGFITNAGTLTVNGKYTNAASFNGNTGTLIINNNGTTAFTNNGSFNAGTGTVNFNGEAQTAVTPNQTLFYNVIIGGTGVKTISATKFVIMGTLSMEMTGTISAMPTYGTPATLQYNRTADFTTSVEWPATFTSTGGVVIKNTGIITLSANKTFSNCPLTVFDGANLDLSNNTITNPNLLRLYCGGLSAGAKITGTGILTLGGNVNVLNAAKGTFGAEISCPLALTNASERSFNVADDGTSAADLTISSIISTTGSLSKNGIGQMTLSGANTFSGGTTLNSGTLNINNASALGNVSGTFTIDGGKVDNTTGGTITTNNHPLVLNDNFSYVGTNSNTLNLGTGAVILDTDIEITSSAGTLLIGGLINEDTKSIAKLGAGILSFGAQVVSINSLTVSAGTFISTSGILSIAGDFLNSATYTHNSGSVKFNGTGTQSINSGGNSFYNFSIANTSGICTANSAITVNQNFDTDEGSNLDMLTNVLSVNTVNHNGSLFTQNTTTTPFTSGKTWGGLVNYNSTSTAQTAVVGTFSDLTITTTGGATASGNITVNGILNLASANPSATIGLLEMGATNVLTMGPLSTTIGLEGDVNGRVKRTSISANTIYSFGNEFSTLSFNAAGTLPSEILFIIKIGESHLSKKNAIKRHYQIIRTGGETPNRFSLKLKYLDSELNGNVENKLVYWDHHVAYAGTSPHEHGKTIQNTTENWMMLSEHGIRYLATEEYVGEVTYIDDTLTPPNVTKIWMLSGKETTADFVWLGATDSNWNDNSNWSGGVVPISTSEVFIPDATTTSHDPIIPLVSPADSLTSPEIKSIFIELGGILNGGTGTTLTINGGLEDNQGIPSWSNSGVLNPGTSTIVFTNGKAAVAGTNDFYNVSIPTSDSLRIISGGIMRIAGALTVDGTLHAVIDGPTTVEYNGTDQTVIVPNSATNRYHNLILSGSGTKTLPTTALNILGDFEMTGTATTTARNTIAFDGNFTLGENTTFNTGSFDHEIKGDFENNGSFVAATGKSISLNGTTQQLILGAQTTNFKNLIVDNTSGVEMLANINVDESLSLTDGNLKMGEVTLGINGSIVKATTSNIEVSLLSSLSFGGSDAITLDNGLFTADPSIKDLTIDRTGGLSVGNQNFTIHGTLALTNGEFNNSGKTLTLNGSISKTSGTLTLNSTSNLIFNENVSSLTFPDNMFTNTPIINNLSIDRSGGIIVGNQELTINGTLDLENGTFDNSGKTLTINGLISRYDGSLTTSNTSSLIFNENTALLTLQDGMFTNNPDIKIFSVDRSGGIETGNQPITINTQLDLKNGIINTRDGSIIILTATAGFGSGTAGSLGSHILGCMRKIGKNAFTFPLGDGVYAPLSISDADGGGADADHFTACYYSEDSDNLYSTASFEPGLNNISREEYWMLNRSGTNNVSVTLNWGSHSGMIDNIADLRVVRWDGTKWKNEGSSNLTGDITSGSITSDLISVFSPFTLGSVTKKTILPIELIELTGKANTNNIELQWTTATETNNDYFTVEKLVSGNWNSIGTVKGAGNSNQIENYNLFDTNPVQGTQYYRLKQTDYDANFDYSEVIAVSFYVDKPYQVSVFPNPANSIVNIDISGIDADQMSVRIFNSLGKVVLHPRYLKNQTNQIDVSNLITGIYFIEIEINNSIERFKLVKTH